MTKTFSFRTETRDDPDGTPRRHATVTRIHEPIIESCPLCGSPVGFGAQLQAICVALLDVQGVATEEQKARHTVAIELAQGVIRSRIREASRR